jgi:hypothetical protein
MGTEQSMTAASRIERLREALKPFARIAELRVSKADPTIVCISLDQCWDARAALSQKGER